MIIVGPKYLRTEKEIFEKSVNELELEMVTIFMTLFMEIE
jgi:hypothetical protein